MTDLPGASITMHLLNVLREGIDGASGPSPYFVDTRPGTGLSGTLTNMSASDASRLLGGTTIAAHVYHVAFGMRAAAAAIVGDDTQWDWAESWRVTSVDDAAWTELRKRLDREYDSLRRSIQLHALSGDDRFGEAIGAITHVAYHLGAIRQKMLAP